LASPLPDSWLREAACVDLRDAESYAAERPRGAVRLEVDDLLHRPYLLPARARPLVLVGGDTDRLQLVVTALRAAGHAHVRHLSEDNWRQHLPAESGPPSRTFLWEPATALVEALDLYAPPSGSTALDLASGSGRNAVYLALRGYASTAIDILPDALERTRDLAARSGVVVRTQQTDLEFRVRSTSCAPTSSSWCASWIARSSGPCSASSIRVDCSSTRHSRPTSSKPAIPAIPATCCSPASWRPRSPTCKRLPRVKATSRAHTWRGSLPATADRRALELGASVGCRAHATAPSPPPSSADSLLS
jgi:rhodanese-related sulfurtransferase